MRSARILFKGQEAGVLYETPRGGSRFVYATGWNGGIGCSLPSHEREHGWPVGLHPFFQHLGPEGWLREKQARVGRLQEQDDFGLLIRYGRDCIGAVSIVADAPADAPPPVEADPLSRAATAGKRTVSGVQKKLLVHREVAKRAAKSRVIRPPAGEEADGFVHQYAEIVRAACVRIAGE